MHFSWVRCPPAAEVSMLLTAARVYGEQLTQDAYEGQTRLNNYDFS